MSRIALGSGKEPSSLIATLWPKHGIMNNNDAMHHTYNFVIGLKFIIYSFLILFDRSTAGALLSSARKIFCRFFCEYHKPAKELFDAVNGLGKLISGKPVTEKTGQTPLYKNTSLFHALNRLFLLADYNEQRTSYISITRNCPAYQLLHAPDLSNTL
jgi:hypothetical protein